MADPHYFKFSTNWIATADGQKRLCGDCGDPYGIGDHIEVTVLKPYTKYVCPTDDGEQGHSSRWTGAYSPELRRPDDKLCVCGAEFVEEDTETWQLSWEMKRGPDDPWHPVSAIRSRHQAEKQRRGLLELIERGEAIRNVELVKLVPEGGTDG